MRRLIATFALLTVAACSGAAPTTVNPPPPPPAVPASLTVQSGDLQIAEPGLALPVHPAVKVRDASGQAVPNVAVTFAVDSGGGTIAGASAATGTDGVATAGIWTLGPAEGRQTLLVTAGTLPALKLSASAVPGTGPVATMSISSSGGTLTVNRPGSPINGLSVQVPGGALAQPATIAILSRSSAGVTLNDPSAGLRAQSRVASARSAPALQSAALMSGVAAVLPLITMQVTGPQLAAGEVAIRIPLPAGTTGDLMVAVLDSANRPVTFLPVIASDPVSITVTTRAFDWRMYATVAAGAAPTTADAGPYTLTLAVFPTPRAGTVPLNQVLPTTCGAPYVLGLNNFEFLDQPTALTPNIDGGMMLAEIGGMYQFPGGIFNTNERLTGVTASNLRGIMLAAGLGKELEDFYGSQYDAVYAKGYYDINPLAYSWGVATALYNTVCRSRWPTPLRLTDGVRSRTVLVLGWNSAGSYFIMRDPAYPSAATYLSWVNGAFTPYQDPYNPSVRYHVPYFNPGVVPALWPRIYAEVQRLSPALDPAYVSAWPTHRYDARDVIFTSNPRWQGTDSLFMLDDTTRIWYSMQNPRFSNPTTISLGAGYGEQGAWVYEGNSGANRWDFNSSLSGNETFIDVRTAGQGGGKWYQKSLGLILRALESNNGTSDSWLGVFRLDVVKYAVGITMTPTFTTSADFSVTQAGGPQLPSDARYQWDFGDGTPIVMRSTKSLFQHTFPGTGPYKVKLSVLHATSPQLVLARVTVDYPPLGVTIAPTTLLASPGNTKTLTAAVTGPVPAGAKYRWNYGDGTKVDTTVAPSTTHTYTASATYTITLDIILGNQVLVSAPPATAIVKVYPAAWRITSFTLTSFSLVQPDFPAEWLPGLISIQGLLDRVVQTPSDGMIFLEDSVLFNEHAVYFQVAPAGTGANAIYYVPASFFTLLARDATISSSHYITTGTLRSGTIDGAGYTANLGTILENSILAQKTATQLLGTLRIAPTIWQGWGGQRTYQFTATLVTP